MAARRVRSRRAPEREGGGWRRAGPGGGRPIRASVRAFARVIYPAGPGGYHVLVDQPRTLAIARVSDVLTKLAAVLESRKAADPQSSYVAGLYARGLDAILKKIGEEATETVIAAKGGDNAQIVYETADLWFHTLVLLARQGLGPDDVLKELDRRFGLSGLEEKAARREPGR